MQTIQYVGLDPDVHILEIAGVVENNLFNRLSKFLTDSAPHQYLSADQVCDRFSVTKPTIHEWRKRGILKSFKLGSRVYYRMDDIENAMIIN